MTFQVIADFYCSN